MGTQCKKCCGLLAGGYDVNLRESYQYCVNCGFRPQWQGRHHGGQLMHVPVPCRRCKEHPGVSVTYPNKGVVVTELCQYCRIEHLARRRAKKKLQREAVEV